MFICLLVGSLLLFVDKIWRIFLSLLFYSSFIFSFSSIHSFIFFFLQTFHWISFFFRSSFLRVLVLLVVVGTHSFTSYRIVVYLTLNLCCSCPLTTTLSSSSSSLLRSRVEHLQRFAVSILLSLI